MLLSIPGLDRNSPRLKIGAGSKVRETGAKQLDTFMRVADIVSVFADAAHLGDTPAVMFTLRTLEESSAATRCLTCLVETACVCIPVHLHVVKKSR